LCSIVERGARVMNFTLTRDGAVEIARRSRGTPRVAGRLLRRVIWIEPHIRNASDNGVVPGHDYEHDR